MIRPCKCCGSAAFVHFECLKIWIEKRSEDKDGVLRQFLRIDCEMCKHQFIFHTHITESFSCDEYARMDTCRAEIVL
ncbi:MAG: hypothetical protein JST59_01435 [Actinobacteria bacterium]|nr:hypothetical protein [Actinomycetota bacterium]